MSVDGLDAIEEAIVDTPHDVPDALRDPRIEAMGIIGTVIVRGWVVVKMRGVFIESMSVEHVQPGYEAWADAQLATMWLTGRYGWLLSRFQSKDSREWMRNVYFRDGAMFVTNAFAALRVDVDLGVNIAIRPIDKDLLLGSLKLFRSVGGSDHAIVSVDKVGPGAVLTFGDVGLCVGTSVDDMPPNAYTRCFRDPYEAQPLARFCLDSELLASVARTFDPRKVEGAELHGFVFGGLLEPIQFHGTVAGYPAVAALMPMRSTHDPVPPKPQPEPTYDGWRQ